MNDATTDIGAAVADELKIALLETQLLNFVEDHVSNAADPMNALRQLSIALTHTNGAVHGTGLQMTMDQINLKSASGLADGATNVGNAFERCALGITYQSLIFIAVLRDGLKVNIGLDDERFKVIFDRYGGGDASKLLDDIDKLGISYTEHFQRLLEARTAKPAADAEISNDSAA